MFLAAFESLAVTTIMPIVTADLNGRGLYSLAFSATLAAGVVGMVVSGGWADSRGPAAPLLTAIGLFAAGPDRGRHRADRWPSSWPAGSCRAWAPAGSRWRCTC